MRINLVRVPAAQAYFGRYDMRQFGVPFVSFGLGLLAVVVSYPANAS